MKLVLAACVALAAAPLWAQGTVDDRTLLEARIDLLEGRSLEAVDVIRAAAEAGNPRGQHLYASIWDFGDTGVVDVPEALRWYGLAADQGFPAAMHNIGLIHRYGAEGVQPDPAVALAQFQRAAALDYGPSLAELGIMYRDGIGVAADLDLSLLYLGLGVDQGDADAASVLGWAYQNGIGVAPDDFEARRLYAISAGQNAINGLVNLGQYAEHGWGGPVDLQLAVDSNVSAMEQGYALAGLNMAYLIARNPDRGTPLDAAAHCLWAQRYATTQLEGDVAMECPDLLDPLSPADLKAADKAAQRLVPAL